MDRRIYTLDTSKELHVCRYGNGVKLVRPEQLESEIKQGLIRDTGYRLGEVLDFPCNVYFYNAESKFHELNESSVETCGFESISNAVGKSLFSIAAKQKATTWIENNNAVLASQNNILVEEDISYLNDLPYQAFGVKAPWYNNENKLIGIFGSSIVLGKQAFKESLEKMSPLKLLELKNPNNKNQCLYFAREVAGVYLTKREVEILFHLMRGKTAKETAIVLNISPRTVEQHINNMKIKLKINYKSELIDIGINYLS